MSLRTASLRTALIGFGKMADTYAEDPIMAQHYRYAAHSQVLADHPAFAWDCVIDPSAEARARAAERWGIQQSFATVTEAAAAGYAPDCLVIATPPTLRAAALEPFPSVKAILVEKPLGPSLAEGDALIAMARARNVIVQVNIWRRADETLRFLAGGLIAEKLGRVQAATLIYGNGLHNNGFHMIDLTRMLLGEITAVQALGPAIPGPHLPLPGDFDLRFALSLRGGEMVLAQPVDFRDYRENGFDFWGSDGRLSVWQEGLTFALAPRRDNRAMRGEREIASDAPAPLTTTVGNALWRMYDNLAEAVAGRASLWSPGDSAVQVERVVAALEASLAANGATIEVARG
jgi:predicted dehydrogenase